MRLRMFNSPALEHEYHAKLQVFASFLRKYYEYIKK